MSNKFPLGCDLIPDDPRNFSYANIVEIGGIEVPDLIEVEAYQFNQGQQPACVGMGVGGQKSVREGVRLSPDFLYSLCKREQGYSGWGTNVPLAMKMLQTYGTPKFETIGDIVGKPEIEYLRTCETVSPEVYKEASEFKSSSYWYIYSTDMALVALALHIERVPIVTTMMWYRSYNTPDKDGFLPKPDVAVGGHAFVLRRREVIGGRVKCTFRNSWGKYWGDNGDFHVWEDEIVPVYQMGTFFVDVDVPKDKGFILNKYAGKLIKNPTNPKVYYVGLKKIIWISDELSFLIGKENKFWGDWKDIIEIKENIIEDASFTSRLG